MQGSMTVRNTRRDGGLDRDGSLDGRPGVVAFQGEVLVLEIVQVLHVWVDAHCRERAGLTGELLADLIEMVQVDVGVAGGVDEVAGLQAADVGYHHREQCVGGDVERNTEEGVGAALIELAGKLAFGHIELEQAVARRESHLVHLSGIPGGDEHSSRIRIVLDHIHHLCELVDGSAVGCRPGAPLVAIDRAKVTVLVGPFVPDGDPVILEVLDVGVAGDEPQKFINDRFQVNFLGGQKRESFGEVEAHLVAEDALGAYAGAVVLDHAVGHYVTQKILILFHL